MTSTIERSVAVEAIARHIADRDAFVISVPPTLVQQVAERVDALDAWLAYIDNGTGHVLRTQDRAVFLISDVLSPVMAVVIVPKTVPTNQLVNVVGQSVPSDGTQDLVLLHEGAPYVWSLLLLDACEVADPGSTTQIRINALQNLN